MNDTKYTDALRTSNWNLAPKPVRKRTLLTVGTRLVHKFDGRTGVIVERREVRHPKAAWPTTLWTIRYDKGGFDATGDTGWVRSYFKVLS